MHVILLSLAIIVLLLGIIGCILPVIPGPPLAFLGLLIAHFSKYADFTSNQLWILGSVAVIVQILDYIVPVWGTKKFGGSKAGVWGSTLGLIAGIIVLPFLGIVIGPFGIIGILAGPFLGAYIGESVAGKNSQSAFRSALGSFFGFVAGTLMKLITSFIMVYYLIKVIFFA